MASEACVTAPAPCSATSRAATAACALSCAFVALTSPADATSSVARLAFLPARAGRRAPLGRDLGLLGGPRLAGGAPGHLAHGRRDLADGPTGLLGGARHLL